jgi:hypothetical protein
MAHFDYADKLAHLEIPKVNEQYGQRVLRMIACQEEDPGLHGLAFGIAMLRLLMPLLPPSTVKVQQLHIHLRTTL